MVFLLLVASLVSGSYARAATYTVVNNANAGVGSLRQAIIDANAVQGPHTITFTLPVNQRNILLTTALPRINRTLLIDGNGRVTLTGTGTGVGFELGGQGAVIRSMTIQNFAEAVRIIGPRTNRVEFCTITHNGFGVVLDGGSDHSIIGNVISANDVGIEDGFGSRGTHIIRGNLIGTDESGTNVLGNSQYGILGAGYSQLVIGGTGLGEGNVISGNRTGIHLALFGNMPSVIQGNFVGTDRSGSLNLGNLWDGINLVQRSNRVGGVQAGAGNVIAFNGGAGIVADPPTWIQGNRIFNNGDAGIAEASDDQPLILRVTTSANSAAIEGLVTSAPGRSFRIELFGSDSCDPSGYGEGQRFLGFIDSVTDQAGIGGFTFNYPAALPNPSVVTATATSAATGTSQFSACEHVGSPGMADLSVWQTIEPERAGILSNVTYIITVSNAGPSRATNVVLENLFPVQSSLRGVVLSQGDWTYGTNFDRIICSFGDMNAHASVSARVTVDPFTGGMHTNSVIVSSANADLAPENNVSEVYSEVGACDLGLRLAVGPGPYQAGIPFSLSIQVTNAGPDIAEYVYVSVWSWGIAVQPGTIIITNFEAGASQNIPVSAVALSNGLFQIGASLNNFSQPDPVSTNNSHSLNITAEPGPGTLSLERHAYAIQENGHAIVRVLRAGGSAGVLVASYATSNGTAMAGADYTAASGQLTFADGQSEAQIVLTAVPDQTPECNELFTLHLFSQDGSTIIGSTSNVMVSIAERPPQAAGYWRPATVSPADPRKLVGGRSWDAGLSADGRTLIFESSSADLLAPQTQAQVGHIFLRDLVTGATRQLTPKQLPTEVPYKEFTSPLLSGNAQVATYISYYWSNTYHYETVAHDLSSGSNLVLATGTDFGWTRPVMISSNGATVALVDSSNHLHAVEMPGGERQPISAAWDGTLPPNNFLGPTLHGISADGRYALFTSRARLLTNDLNSLDDLYLRDVIARQTYLVSVNAGGMAGGIGYGGSLSADGRWAAFSAFGGGFVPGDTGFGVRIYLRDLVAETTRLVNTNSGAAYQPSISADGRFVAFESSGINRTDILLRDMQSGVTAVVTRNCSASVYANRPRVSDDGRFVFFQSPEIDLTDGEFLPLDFNLFRWDRLADQITLVSVNKHRTGATAGFEYAFAMSFDGNVLSSTTDSADFVFGDTNAIHDVFVWQAGALPQLSISFVDGTVTVSWPSDAPPAVLEAKTEDAEWVSVPAAIEEEPGKFRYRFEAQGSSPRFFRLRLL